MVGEILRAEADAHTCIARIMARAVAFPIRFGRAKNFAKLSVHRVGQAGGKLVSNNIVLDGNIVRQMCDRARF